MSFYLIKRGAPQLERACKHESVVDHPVIICDRLVVAKWEDSSSADQCWVWEKLSLDSSGFLLCVWKGLEINYGNIVRSFVLPDGTTNAAIFHDRSAEPWTLLKSAVWWSVRRLPQWMEDQGVVYPADKWTREKIVRDYDLDHSRTDGRNSKSFLDLPEKKLAPWLLEVLPVYCP